MKRKCLHNALFEIGTFTRSFTFVIAMSAISALRFEDYIHRYSGVPSVLTESWSFRVSDLSITRYVSMISFHDMARLL